MPSDAVHKILADIARLTDEERGQLQQLLQRNGQQPIPTEEEFEEILLARGILKSRPTRAPRPPWTPVVISGPPLSQTIIEDRR